MLRLFKSREHCRAVPRPRHHMMNSAEATAAADTHESCMLRSRPLHRQPQQSVPHTVCLLFPWLPRSLICVHECYSPLSADIRRLPCIRLTNIAGSSAHEC
jgi:hypothetical protein